MRWVNPGDWLAVIVKAADSKAWVYKRVNDGILQSPLSSGSTVSLTNGNWYTGKVVVGDAEGDQGGSPKGNSALQRLGWRGLPARGRRRRRRLAGEDARPTRTWSDETALLDTTTVDDDWSAGHAGLFHGHVASTAVQDFDDVKIGFDNNADLDLDDAGDSIVINDDFASNATSLSYDDNGSLTDDGIFKFAYDAWNRLVSVKSRYTGGTTQTMFATYAYDGANRRNSKVVANSGVEVYPNDGGETTVHFYYGGVEPEPTPFGGLMPKCWNIFETRNGSNQSTWQYFWGTQYVDEIILTDKNGDPTVVNDCDPDGTAGESSESPVDHRYFYHQDRNWNVAALSDYGDSVNGVMVERYDYTPYGVWTVHTGIAGAAALARKASESALGNSFGLHTAPADLHARGYHNRQREYDSHAIRYRSRDSLDYADSMSLYSGFGHSPLRLTDPFGLVSHAECDSDADNAQNSNEKGTCLVESIRNEPHCAPPTVECKCCGTDVDPKRGAWFDSATNTITICENRFSTTTSVIEATVHELQHAYDQCKKGDITDCEGRACRELRAYDLSGQCASGGSLRQVGETYRDCMIRNAAQSTSTDPTCGDGKSHVERVYARCMKDKRPCGSSTTKTRGAP